MHHRLSKTMKKIIFFNLIIILILLCFHVYNVYRVSKSNDIIKAYMLEHSTDRNTSIRYLIRDGVDIVVDGGFFSLFGIFSSIVSIYYTNRYIKSNLIHHGIMSALFSFFTNFFGGLVLFYFILSGKSESHHKNDNDIKEKDEWGSWLYKRNINDIKDDDK